MRKESLMKKGLALALVGAMAISLFALSGKDSYAASAIETARKCTLSVKVGTTDAFQEDLNEMTIPVNLYKVADVDVTGNYTELGEFEGIGLDKINSETNAEQWDAMAKAADAKITEQTVVADTISMDRGEGTSKELDTGMYLVKPAETFNADYSYLYKFTPYLTALPGNHYNPAEPTSSDEWDYAPTIGLKAGREMQYGELKITKTLNDYNEVAGRGFFVFQIEGEKDTVKYSNVVSLTFDEGGEKSVTVEHIPAGMKVKVTEVYSGGSYAVDGVAEQEVTINSDKNATVSVAEASFVNKYDDKIIPGTGVLNQFEKVDGSDAWKWVNNQKEEPQN